MRTTDKKKIAVKKAKQEDTTKYIDYSQPLNFKQLLHSNNQSFQKRKKKAA